jgi:hypothetical protein
MLASYSSSLLFIADATLIELSFFVWGNMVCVLLLFALGEVALMGIITGPIDGAIFSSLIVI